MLSEGRPQELQELMGKDSMLGIGMSSDGKAEAACEGKSTIRREGRPQQGSLTTEVFAVAHLLVVSRAALSQQSALRQLLQLREIRGEQCVQRH